VVPREQPRAGEIQAMPILPRSEDLADEVRTLPGIKVAAFPDATYTELVYNLRDGRLFADPQIREALELAIAKPQTVDTATHGHGQVIYSPIDPISWAFQPDLVRPERDVTAAR